MFSLYIKFICYLFRNPTPIIRIVVFDKASEYLPSKYQAVSSKLEHDNPLNFQMAAIVLVALPIVSIYPFIQKYFVKGILTGSVKE